MTDQRLLDAVMSAHHLKPRTLCGAISIPLVHHHGSESDKRPGPLRVMRCTEDAGHQGPHKDAVCCWNFQAFEDWQVAERKPRAFDQCSCGSQWPCATVKAIQQASVRVTEEV